MIISADELRDFIERILTASGAERPDARRVSAHLVEANLKGHDSHGVGVVPSYVTNVRSGVLKPKSHARLAQEFGSIAIFDGGMGFGQVTAHEAVDWAIAKAKQAGVGIVALRNTHHIGRVGTYGEQAAASGLISIHFVNVLTGVGRVAPFGGIDGRYGTDPICITFPAMGGLPPVVLDFATSRIAVGKIRVAMNEGKALPPGMLIDDEGLETTDPALFLRGRKGSLLPFGEHKGSGLALICQLLGGALTGAGTVGKDMKSDGGVRNGMFSILVDPARVSDSTVLSDEVTNLVEWVKSATPRPGVESVLVAGEPERLSMETRLRDGVPIDDTTWQELGAAARLVGVNAA